MGQRQHYWSRWEQWVRQDIVGNGDSGIFELTLGRYLEYGLVLQAFNARTISGCISQ